MEIAPEQPAFAARYSAGAPQLVSTTLVADLETPVSAFLKLAGGKRNAFLFESVEGGAVRGRYSIIGLEPDLVWRTNGERGRDQPQRADQARRVRRPAPSRRSQALRALIAESRIDTARAAAADGGRRVRLSRLRHGAADGEAAGAEAGPDRPFPTRCWSARRIVVIFDAVQDTITIVTPVRPDPAVNAKAALRPRGRAPERGGRRAGQAARQAVAADAEVGPIAAAASSNTTRRANSRPWCCGPRNTSWPAISSRSCCRSASRRRSRCRRSRSIARCGA